MTSVRLSQREYACWPHSSTADLECPSCQSDNECAVASLVGCCIASSSSTMASITKKRSRRSNARLPRPFKLPDLKAGEYHSTLEIQSASGLSDAIRFSIGLMQYCRKKSSSA